MKAAIYARVSTADQDLERQLHECRDHLDSNYPDIDETDEYDIVVVHEISHLSRLGPTEIHEFIQHALESETGIESLDVGLSIRVDDPALQRTVYTIIANIMGDLAKIEHRQKLERINSGIRAAQREGKWTSKPPRGFYVGDDSRLHVDPEEFLNAVTRSRGSPTVRVSDRSPRTLVFPARRSRISTTTRTGDRCTCMVSMMTIM